MGAREIDQELQRAVQASATVEVVRDLLGRKADPNLPTASGQSLLDVAVSRSDPTLCRLLLVYQADTTGRPARHADSEAAKLVQAWSSGNVPTVFSALEELVIDAASGHDVTLLGVALTSIDIAGGDAERVAVLQDEAQNSLLHLCAVSTSQVRDARAEARARLTARALLGWGVPVDSRNAKGETSLLLAMRAMHSLMRSSPEGSAPAVPAEPARALLESRADVETVDPETEETLLMQATKEGDQAACALLLEFGADPLRQNGQGKSAINLSADRPEVLLLLRTNLMNRSGEQEAFSDHSPAVMRVSQEHRRSWLPSESTRPDPVLLGDGGVDNEVEADAGQPVTALFSMSEEQETCSAEGLLNQVDLEESYDTDWNIGQVNLESSYDADWKPGPLPLETAGAEA